MIPVPPYNTPTLVVAPTTPLRASSGPLREPARVSTPAELKEEVAVAPNTAPYAESAVVLAFPNVWSAVHTLAFAILRLTVAAAVSAPELPTVIEPDDVSVAR